MMFCLRTPKEKNRLQFLKKEALASVKVFLVIYVFLFFGIQFLNAFQMFKARIETQKFQEILAKAKNIEVTNEKNLSIKEPVLINEPDSIIISKISVRAPIVFVDSIKLSDLKAL